MAVWPTATSVTGGGGGGGAVPQGRHATGLTKAMAYSCNPHGEPPLHALQAGDRAHQGQLVRDDDVGRGQLGGGLQRQHARVPRPGPDQRDCASRLRALPPGREQRTGQTRAEGSWFRAEDGSEQRTVQS